MKDDSYIIEFGKYKGKTLGWIATNNPGYIIWLFEKNLLWIDSALINDCRRDVSDRWDDLENAAAEYGNEDWGDRD